MRFLITILILLTVGIAFSQEPSAQEKEILKVINEMRQDPQGFLEREVKPYIENHDLRNNRYARSLIRELRDLEPLPSFSIDSSLQEMAKTFAVKSGNHGWFGHRNYSQRFDDCASHLAHDAENIQYGLQDPLEIVIDLLIDIDVPSLGHRKNLLDPKYTVLGIGFADHKTYGCLTVMAFGGF